MLIVILGTILKVRCNGPTNIVSPDVKVDVYILSAEKYSVALISDPGAESFLES
jgi:hypothetical protein